MKSKYPKTHYLPGTKAVACVKCKVRPREGGVHICFRCFNEIVEKIENRSVITIKRKKKNGKV